MYVVTYGEKEVYAVASLEHAVELRDKYAKDKVCDIEEMYPTEPCSVTLSTGEYGGKYLFKLGDTILITCGSPSICTEYRDEAIGAKLCYDLYEGHASHYDSTKNLIQLTGNIPEYILAPKDKNHLEPNIYDEFQRFTKPKDPSRNISGEKPEKTKGV